MTRPLQTVVQAVRVLEAFDADHAEWTLSALAQHLQEPTSSLHEQLTTLTACGLLHKLGRGRYGLGWRLLKLSSALYLSLPWYAPAHAAMERLARSTHLLTFLCVLDGPRVLCIGRSVQGRDGATVAGELDFELPPHATASGKVLYALAGLEPPSGPHYTPYTSQQSWTAEAADIRAGQLAQTQDEWAIGTSSLAVPILGPAGEVLAALGLSLPTARLSGREGLERKLRDASAEVGWALGYRKAGLP